MAYSKNNKKQLDVISYLDITKTIYNSLTSLNNTNEFYKGENEELNIKFNVELSFLLDSILEKDDKKNKNLDFEVEHCVITFISKGNGYLWIYQSKNQKKNSFLLTYYYNYQIKLIYIEY